MMQEEFMKGFLNKILLLFFLFLSYSFAYAGPYLDSAHGNNNYGVKRNVTQLSGYARGNCAHCHEQHAMIGGTEPQPASGSASPFCLFAKNFSKTTANPYQQSDDFCFYCHCYTDATSLQTSNFTNYNYSRTFGGYTSSSIDSIYEAFNQNSYHNLYDVWEFANTNTEFSWFKDDSNPCCACHNTHLARRNKEHKGDPTYSAISKPSDHFNLWTNTMNDYAPNKYQAPYRYSGGCEPDGGSCSDLTGQAQKTPDYATFCQDCHSYNMSSYGISQINWNADKHGNAIRSRNEHMGQPIIKPPYDVTAVSNYVLSCLDCHEPHGSYSYRYLIRKEVNAATTAFTEDSRSAWDSLCIRCHQPHDNDHYLGQKCSECHYHGSNF